MSNIKKKFGNSWKVLASGQATGITVDNPQLLEEGENVTSVDAVLEKHENDINKLYRNVAWLALNGGGGSGGGTGPGGGTVVEADCIIKVNNLISGSDVIMDASGLAIQLADINSELRKNWTVIVRIGNIQVAQLSPSYTNDTVYVGSDKIVGYLSNHTGRLYISATYADETAGIYGKAQWDGNIVESVVNISTTNESFTMDDIDSAQYTYKYSVGIIGEYTLSLEVYKDGNLYGNKSINLNIISTQPQNYSVKVADLLGITSDSDELQVAGVYNVFATLSYNKNTTIHNTYENTITIISNKILLSTTKLSSDINNPVIVNMSGSIYINYTAYLQGYKKYTYKYTITTPNGEVIIKDNVEGNFGEAIHDYVSVYNKDWAVKDTTVPLNIYISAGNQSSKFTYYVKFAESAGDYIKYTNEAQAQLFTSFLSRDYANGESNFNLSQSGYSNNSSIHTITSKLEVINGNYLSVITAAENTGTPYLRLSNGAFAKLDNWFFNGNKYNLSGILSTNKEFTFSICFKADYHPDDFRTIFTCGTVDANTGKILKGISIDVHDVYINSVSKVKLTDNVINMIDITCKQILIYDKEVNKYVEKFLIKIFLDGVLSAVSEENDFIEVGDCIYLGGKQYTGMDGEINDYLCDCNIYNIQLFDAPLSDIDITANYINNLVSTSYIDNHPNFGIVDTELKKNFCDLDLEYNTITSKLFQNGQYSINFLLTPDDKLNDEALTSQAKSLGIPIMLIDVSEDEQWTFDAFVAQQTSGGDQLLTTENHLIQYWDPNGSVDSILNVKGCNVELQGTSTLKDAVKNINITVPNSTVFIPKPTWMPEQTYTLKADVVDSSHSNNASIGNFINTELGNMLEPYFPFDQDAINNIKESEYVNYQQKTATLKHTVEGFPILLIMKFHTIKTGDISVTPLGIYSFNLGRDAYRNLGFKRLNSITNTEDDTKPVIATFPYLLDTASYNETDSNANWIEIKDTSSIKDMIKFSGDRLPEDFNSSTGDFWQDDDKILDYKYEVRYGSKSNPHEYEGFKTFVKNVMSLPIEGTYSTLGAPDKGSNVVIPQVTGPAYDLYTHDGNDYVKKGGKQNFTIDANDFPNNPGFNYDSACKYFVIALLFGLIDNFGKNSTYRSWNDKEYYVDFYDLDCAFGGGNQGLLDIYPDTWIKYLRNNITDSYGYVCETYDESLAQSKNVVSANHNKLWLSLDTIFYRGKRGETSRSTYSRYWSDLRYKLKRLAEDNGYKDGDFVEYFINEYYIKQTGNCGPLLFNYDYKLKYLLQFNNEENISSSKDLTKLHGRKIAYAKDWLKKHILFLDSVFAWRDKGMLKNFPNNLDNTSSGSVYNTPKTFTITANTPIIVNHSVGSTTDTMYFMPKNQEVVVNAGSNSSNSVLTWSITNSSNIIKLGNDDNKLSDMNLSILNASPNENSWDIKGFPAITDLNLSGNTKFGSGFNLDSFELGAISELRTLDFSKTSGESFALNLNKRTPQGEVFTKYTKLTKIDISESTCVSDLVIPDIPLKELSVYKSTITEFILKNQKYLSNIDLTGCTKLTKIEINTCDSYTEFEINNLTNLNSLSILSCPNIKTIKINNCPNLKKINIEKCSGVESIIINNCISLVGGAVDNYITISECNILNELNLSNNTNLTTISIAKSNHKHMSIFDISNTKIAYMTIDDKADDKTLLDMSAFENLTSFACTINKAVSFIQFANISGKPIPLNKSFYNCSNLQRVYGNVILSYASYSNVAGLFRDCPKFSIHGTEATTWKGKDIKSGTRILTPWEILTGSADGSDYNNVILGDLFQSGNKVTNFSFSNSSDLLNYTFYGTAVSQFDIYYTFCALALSNVNTNQAANYTFYNIANGVFDWGQNCHPNRYMFYKCSMITSFTYTFKTVGVVFLQSPETDKDNGLFSPLTNVTYMSYMFTSGTVFSRKLFHKTSGNYKMTSWSGIIMNNVFDDDTNFPSKTDYDNRTSKLDKLGNFSNFFKNLPSMNTISDCGSIEYLDFNTLRFHTTMTSIINSFNITYAKGTLDLELMFPKGSMCTNLCKCFIVSGTDVNYGNKAEMPIRSTTFSHLLNITNVGHNHGQGTVYGSATDTSFRGSGLRKYIEDDSFPESIVSNCKNLRTFSGFFREVETRTFNNIPKIPGNMFLNNKNLLSVAGLMYNAKFPYKLSSNGFANCNSLSDVSYMCYFSISAGNRSPLIGEIPYKLFYHGQKPGSVTYKGVNQREKPTETGDDALRIIQTRSVSFNNVNKNITRMEYCFNGCTGLEYYTNEEQLEYVEDNVNYQPFEWLYNEVTDSWTQRSDAFLKDASWGYDGSSEKNSEYKYLEGDVKLVTANTVSEKNETLNYMCAPDLLRYCVNSANTNVNGLFARCGLSYSSNVGGTASSSDGNVPYNVGITGRIVPYLLQPVSNITSIYEMFRFCRKLSSYEDSDNNIYQVPKEFFKYAPKITNLGQAFQGISLVFGTKLDVFNYLIGALDIRAIFANAHYGSDSEGKTNTYSGIFTGNTIGKISGAFSYKDLALNNSNTLGMDYTSIYKITGINNKIYFENNFNVNKIPKSTNIGYVYLGWNTNATDNAIKNENYNYKE